MENFTPTDAIALENSRGGYGYGDGMMSWFWIIIILFFAWGNNGWGNNNNGLQENIDTRFLERDVFSTNQNVSTTGCQTQRDVLENRYTTQLGLANLGSEMQECCCATQKEILENRFQNALQTNTLQNQAATNALNAQMQLAQCCCDLKAEGLANTQKILDKLCQNQVDELRDRLATANTALTVQTISDNVINQLRPHPIPSYITCSPYESAFLGFNRFNDGCGFNRCGFNNGCGCNI